MELINSDSMTLNKVSQVVPGVRSDMDATDGTVVQMVRFEPVQSLVCMCVFVEESGVTEFTTSLAAAWHPQLSTLQKLNTEHIRLGWSRRNHSAK